MRGRGETLRPRLHDEAPYGSDDGRDGQGEDQPRSEAQVAVAVGQGDADEHPGGADGNLDGDQVGEVVVLCAAPDGDDLEGEGYGAAESEDVSAVERGQGESLPGRNAEQVEANAGGQYSGEGVAVDVTSPEEGQQDGYQHHADTGEEGRLRGRGVEQTGRLELIAQPHQGADGEARAPRTHGHGAELAAEDDHEKHGGQDHAHGIEDQR